MDRSRKFIARRLAGSGTPEVWKAFFPDHSEETCGDFYEAAAERASFFFAADAVRVGEFWVVQAGF